MSLLGLGGYWARYYTGSCGNCDTCDERDSCPNATPTVKHGKIPDDCFEHNCFKCPRMFDGSCSFWMGDDVPLTKNTWYPPPEPSVECPQRCASCQWAPTCEGLKRQFEFAKDFQEYMDDYWEICRQEDRSLKNFHDCLNCKRILTCKILKRSMS